MFMFASEMFKQPSKPNKSLMKRVLSTIAKRVALTLINLLIYLVIFIHAIYVLLRAFFELLVRPEKFYKSFRFEFNIVADKLLRHE